MLQLCQLLVLSDNYTYLIHDTESGETVAIDPAVAEPVLKTLNEQGWKLTHIFNTHHHYDHVEGNLELKQKTGCSIIASAVDTSRIAGVDKGVIDDEIVMLGQYPIQVIATPGHTQGHVCYYFSQQGWLFCGDTLFTMGCGRLLEGTAEQMWHSLQKLRALPATTQVYCAHEYTQANGRFALTVEPDNAVLKQRMTTVDYLRSENQPTVPSTLEMEWATNPFLRADSMSMLARFNQYEEDALNIFTHLRSLKDSFKG